MSADWEQDFRSTLAQAQQPLPPGERITVDDRVHRYRGGEDKEADAWYALHSVPARDGNGVIIVGAYGHWARLPAVSYCSRQKNQISKEEWGDIARAQKDIAQRRADDEKRGHDEARAKVAGWLSRFPKAEFHLYLSAKGVEASGDLREFTDELYNGWLCLPLKDASGVVHSAQMISDEGDKKFCYGGRVKGCFFQVSDVPGGPVIVCEGYATGASIFMATGWTVICAMDCGNILPVVQDLRVRYPDRLLMIAADNDQFKNPDKNPGVEAARRVSKTVKNTLLCIPEFSPSILESKPTDFNDLHQLSGLDAVRSQIYGSFPILKVLESRRYDPDARPPEIRPIYTCQDKVICTPGNLTTITSGVKTGKTAVIGAMISAAMTNGTEGIDNLSFKSQNPDKKAVIHFDSEQSPDDHWFAVDRILRRAQLERTPDWFFSYCLTGLGAKMSWDCVKQAHEVAAQACAGIHSTFNDGAADLVSDVNDPEECNALVSQLHDLAIKYQCPSGNVIHFNPGSEKSRGHLGSQLERKAETNLILEKDQNEITRIYSVKNRRAGIPKAEGPCFQYDEERRLHITCDPPPESKRGRYNETDEIAASNLYTFLSACEPGGEGKNQISKRLMAYLKTINLELSFSSCKTIIEKLAAPPNSKLALIGVLYFKGPNA